MFDVSVPSIFRYTAPAPSYIRWMNRHYRVAVLSDVHYAGPLEQARGDDYEFKAIPHPFLRALAKLYRNHIWLLNPTRQNGLLDRFMSEAGEPDMVVANGDYNCDTD